MIRLGREWDAMGREFSPDYWRPPLVWEQALRQEVPISRVHSFPVLIYNQLVDRWVLYDVIPEPAIQPQAMYPNLMKGQAILDAFHGPPPSVRTAVDPLLPDLGPALSDVQWRIFREWGGYGCPFWILQGDQGGHQVTFTPWEREMLATAGLPTEPPKPGMLPKCAFDRRVIVQLRHRNRLAQLGGSLERLRETGTPEGQAAEQERVLKQMRRVALAYLEQQVAPMVEVTDWAARKSAVQDFAIPDPGAGARATDAIARYIETGETIL